MTSATTLSGVEAPDVANCDLTLRQPILCHLQIATQQPMLHATT